MVEFTSALEFTFAIKQDNFYTIQTLSRFIFLHLLLPLLLLHAVFTWDILFPCFYTNTSALLSPDAA